MKPCRIEGCPIGLHDLEKGDVFVESEPPPPPPPRPPSQIFTPVPLAPVESPPSWPVLLAKFLLHGLALNLLMLIVVFLWAFLLVGLVICGYILGLLIALVILIIVYGYVNSWITRVVWFDVETGLLACFLQGIVLFLASLIPAAMWAVLGGLFPWTGSDLRYNYLFVSVPFPNPAALVVGYLVSFILMGFLGRAVASLWRREAVALPPLYESDDP